MEIGSNQKEIDQWFEDEKKVEVLLFYAEVNNWSGSDVMFPVALRNSLDNGNLLTIGQRAALDRLLDNYEISVDDEA